MTAASDALPRGLGFGGLGGQHRQLREFRLVLRLFLGAVAVEPIGAQHGAQRDIRRLRGVERAVGDGGRRFLRQVGGDGAAGFLEDLGVHFGRLAQADGENPGQVGARRQDYAGLALAALELRDLESAGDRAAGRLIGLLPQPGRFFALIDQQCERAGLWQRRLGEGDIEHAVGVSGRIC